MMIDLTQYLHTAGMPRFEAEKQKQNVYYVYIVPGRFLCMENALGQLTYIYLYVCVLHGVMTARSHNRSETGYDSRWLT